MTNNIAKIRAALEMARDYITSDLASERGAFEGYEGLSRIGEIKADIEENEKALAALSELEMAAATPVAWMWNDMLGISHTYVSPKRPTWPDAGASPEMEMSINVRPLYTTPPAPVAEIREPTPEECERICTEYERLLMREGTCGGRDAFDAVRAVMWPKEGL